MKHTARLVALVAALALVAQAAVAQQKASPSDTVVAFYRLLREQRYAEGFALSVYSGALQGLSPEDLAELTPEFQRTFSNIPEKISVDGEQVSGEAATVFARFGDGQVEPVALIRQDGRWIVGDRETLDQVTSARAAFFFNARIDVNQTETLKLVRQIVGAQQASLRAKKSYGSIDELIASQGLPEELRGGVASGYKFEVNLTSDRQNYTITAIPERYGRTGTLSFFADVKGVHAGDAKGAYAGPDAPLVPAANASPTDTN